MTAALINTCICSVSWLDSISVKAQTSHEIMVLILRRCRLHGALWFKSMEVTRKGLLELLKV